jgi:large subunit ribosomal protein L13
MSTKFQTNEQATENRKWVLIDANDQVVGRLATKIAHILKGKHKPTYTPHNDGGDFVVVVNADKIKFTGDKEHNKIFRYHTGFAGGLVEMTAADVRSKHPERIVELAVKGMLPKSALGKNMIKKLKIYAGESHPHEAQNPESLKF